MTARLETIGSLLTAMAVVALTGELPQRSESPSYASTFDLSAKPKLIVPLRKRFSGLFLYSRFGVFRGHHESFSPRVFLMERFGLDWDFCYTRELLDAQVMPSTIQIALAMHMANGDADRAGVLLAHRGGRGINAAVDSVNKFRAGCLPRALWRYPGNADELWYGLRDAMADAVATLSGGDL